MRYEDNVQQGTLGIPARWRPVVCTNRQTLEAINHLKSVAQDVYKQYQDTRTVYPVPKHIHSVDISRVERLYTNDEYTGICSELVEFDELVTTICASESIEPIVEVVKAADRSCSIVTSLIEDDLINVISTIEEEATKHLSEEDFEYMENEKYYFLLYSKGRYLGTHVMGAYNSYGRNE